MNRSYLASATVAGNLTTLIEQLSDGLRGRIYDTGEFYASDLDRDEVFAAADAVGLAPDTALCVDRPGAMCIHSAVTATVAGTTDLSTAALSRANGNASAEIAGATFASADYFRYSTATPLWRLDGLLLAGYVPDGIHQYIRSAIERSLARAEITVADVVATATAASEEVSAAVDAALGEAADHPFRSAADIVATLAEPAEIEHGPRLVMLEDAASMTVCTFVLQPIGEVAP